MFNRLESLEKNIYELKKFKLNISIEQVEDDKFKEWALRYGLFESIQIVIDISCHLVSKYNLGITKTYSECIKLLLQFDYIEKGLSMKLISMIGLRNILIHEYVKIEVHKIYDLLDFIEDFKIFIQKIKEYI